MKKMQANHIDMFENKIVHLYLFFEVLRAEKPLERKNTNDVSGAFFLFFVLHFNS